MRLPGLLLPVSHRSTPGRDRRLSARLNVVWFVPALIVFFFGFIGLALMTIAAYQTRRKEGSLRPYARAITAGVLGRLAVLLVALLILLVTLGRQVSIGLLVLISFLILASTIIRVSDAVQRVRNASVKSRVFGRR